MSNSYETLVKLTIVHEDLCNLIGRNHPLTQKIKEATYEMADLFNEGVEL